MRGTYVIHIWLISCGHVDGSVCCVRELSAARLMASRDKKISVLSRSSRRTFMMPSTSRPTCRTINALMANVMKRLRICDAESRYDTIKYSEPGTQRNVNSTVQRKSVLVPRTFYIQNLTQRKLVIMFFFIQNTFLILNTNFIDFRRVCKLQPEPSRKAVYWSRGPVEVRFYCTARHAITRVCDSYTNTTPHHTLHVV